MLLRRKLCMRACVRACVLACVRACVRVRLLVRLIVWLFGIVIKFQITLAIIVTNIATMSVIVIGVELLSSPITFLPSILLFS